MKEATFVPEIPVLGPPEDDDVKLLAQALRSITQRLSAIEEEQKAMDANMAHVAQALQAVIEAAAAKMGVQS